MNTTAMKLFVYSVKDPGASKALLQLVFKNEYAEIKETGMHRFKATYLYICIFFAIFLAEIGNAQEEKSPTVNIYTKKDIHFLIP